MQSKFERVESIASETGHLIGNSKKEFEQEITKFVLKDKRLHLAVIECSIVV